MSGLTSSGSGGGSDNLQVGLAVFCIVISIATALMVPIFAPSYDTGYSYQDVYNERQSLEAFTGESMTNQSPWMLEGVYTPYVPGDVYSVGEEGWINGPPVEGYADIGKTSGIHLDPTQKSAMPFDQESYTVQIEQNKWYYKDGFWGDLYWKIGSGFWGLFGVETSRTELVDKGYQTWEFTGYRYQFDPMLAIQTGGEAKTAESDAKLSIVWYDTLGQEGISGGLVLYSDSKNGLVANYSATDIINGYNISSGFASAYTFDFEGTQVNMYIQFDPEVISGEMDLADAFEQGLWTIAFSATSASNLMSIDSSNSLSNSIGNILSTYSQIFTFSLPTAPLEWSIVLWILCILPVEVAMIMFLSRFGVVGLIGGILGNVLLATG